MSKIKIQILKDDEVGNKKGDVKEVGSNIAKGMIDRKLAKVYEDK